MKKLITILLFLAVALSLNAQLYSHRGKMVKGNGQFAAVPPPTYLDVLNDGNTVAWLKDASTTTTTDGTDSVLVWQDQSGNGNNFVSLDQTGEPPILDGDSIKFNGIAQIMKQTSFSWQNPYEYFIVFRQDEYILYSFITDALSLSSDGITQSNFTPRVRQAGGAGNGPLIYDFPLGVFGGFDYINATGVDTLIYNQVIYPAGLDVNGGNPLGLVLGGRENNTVFSKITVLEVIQRNGTLSPAERTLIYNYLNSRYGF